MNDEYRRSRIPRDRSDSPSNSSPSGVPYQTRGAEKDGEASQESGYKIPLHQPPGSTGKNDRFAQEVLSMNQLMPDFSPPANTKSTGTRSDPSIPLSLEFTEENVSSDSKEGTIPRKDNTTIKEILPKLTKQNYQMSPSVTEMMNFTEEQLSAVSNFTIRNPEFGMVVWDDTVDVRRLDIDKIVSITYRDVTVYPNVREKHQLGQGLNKPATVTLYHLKPKTQAEKHIQKQRAKIVAAAEAKGAELVSYDHVSGHMTIHVQHFSSYNFEGLENLSSQHEEEINEGMREQEDEANPDGDFNFAQLGLFTESSKDDMSGIIDQNPQANPEGKFDFAALGKYTESSNDDSADNINQEVADQEVQDNHAFREVQDNPDFDVNPSSFGRDSDPSSDAESQPFYVVYSKPDDKSHIGTRVAVRCESNPNYFLHGKVTNFDDDRKMYRVEFDERDNAEPQEYTEDQLLKVICRPVVGIGGIMFVPYNGMPVFAYRGEIEEKAVITNAFKNDAKLKWADDDSLSLFCVPYNHMRPVNDDDELKDDHLPNEGESKKTNTGSMFTPYVGCAVMVVYRTMNHPAKITKVFKNEAEVRYDNGSVKKVPYNRMIPVLDNDIPRARRRKCEQFHYIPHSDNSLREFEYGDAVSKQSTPAPLSHLLESLSRHGRKLLKDQHRPLTQEKSRKSTNNEVVTDNYFVYNEEWLRMKALRRGFVTSTSHDGNVTTNISEKPYMRPGCALPSGEWPNFVRTAQAMGDLASASIPKTNFLGVDICLFELSTCLDYGFEMDVRLANASQASIIVLFVPNADECHFMQQFIPQMYTKELVMEEQHEEQNRTQEAEVENDEASPKRKKKKTQRSLQKEGVAKRRMDSDKDDYDVVKHKHLLLLVHAPTNYEVGEVISLMELGFYDFMQTFDLVCALSFSHPNTLKKQSLEESSYFELFGKGRMYDDRYNSCGSLKTFVTSLSQLFLCIHYDEYTFPGNGELKIIPEKDKCKSYMLDFLRNRVVPESTLGRVKSIRWSDTLGDFSPVFGTPSIIERCRINEAKGSVCVSLRAILQNAYECHRLSQQDNKNVQPFHYNSLEFACSSAMCVFVDSKNNKFKVGCLVCNKNALCHDVEGFESIREALEETITRVALVHRIAHSATMWLNGQQVDDHQLLGQTPYRLHLHHLHDSNLSGVQPCVPDRTQLDSCFGMDQLIVSAIENEQSNVSSVGEMAACWADLCNKFFIDESVAAVLQKLEANFLYTVEHGVASAKARFLHKLRQRDLILLDAGDEWKSEECLQECHLINHAKSIMKIDWKGGRFPHFIPDDSPLSENDRAALNNALASKTDGIEFLHQTGILVQYLKHAPENSVTAAIYRKLPSVSYPYAFQRGNMCINIYTRTGRQERLHSSTMFVVQSHINDWSENTQEFINSIADDNNFHITKLRGAWNLNSEIIGVNVEWVLSDELENLLCDNFQKVIKKMKHGEWHPVWKKLKSDMCQYAKGNLTAYQPISFSVQSLHPYQATVLYQNRKTSNEWFGFAKMQVVLANSFYYGSIHHQRAMEIMTNSSFQMPVIHKKAGELNNNISTGYSVAVKWNHGCAIPNEGCPLGISELLTLPHRVVTDDWNCFCSNVRNLLAVLGQLNERIEEEISALVRCGDLGCIKGNLFRELGRVFQSVGYNTIWLPGEMNFDSLAYYAHLIKLPMFISMKMAFNENAIKYGHIIGLCPYFSPGNSEIRMSIVEGAHPQLQQMKFTKENIRWCCGNETQTKFYGFAFFPGKHLSKVLLHKIGQDVQSGLKISVCLARNLNIPYEYKELMLQNVVMGDAEYYQKLLSGIRKNGLRV